MSAVQFTGTLTSNDNQLWFTYGWPTDQEVVWAVVPTTARPGAAMVEWEVDIERPDAGSLTYWLTIHNLTGDTIDFEARYSVVG